MCDLYKVVFDLCDVAKMYVAITWWQEVVTPDTWANHELKGFHIGQQIDFYLG